MSGLEIIIWETSHRGNNVSNGGSKFKGEKKERGLRTESRIYTRQG